MRDQGRPVGEILATLGISQTTYYRYTRPEYAEAGLRASREAKRRRTGTCKLCGGKTSLRRDSSGPADVCGSCSADYYGPLWSQERRGHGPVVEKALAFVGEQPRRYSEIRDHCGITSGHTSVLVHRMLQYGFIERVSRGVYRRAAA